MEFKTYRDASRTNWGRDKAEVTDEHIKLGAVLRIADAVELMAKRYQQLVDDRDMYERWYQSERATVLKLGRSNAALRGHIARLKKSKQAEPDVVKEQA